jgi:hypothetical protein
MGVNPRDFESRASAYSATSAEYAKSICRFGVAVNGVLKLCARRIERQDMFTLWMKRT